MNIPNHLLESIEGAFPRNDMWRACHKFVIYLRKTPKKKLQMLTYLDVAKILGKPTVDDEVFRTVAILTSSSCHLLDSKMLFVDINGDEFELDEDQARQAVFENAFSHPEKGVPVPDFKKRLYPFFCVAETLNGDLD